MDKAATVAKARFRERSEHCLDDKGRLNLPSRFREQLRFYDSETLMISIWGRDHLRVYPLADWEEMETELEDKWATLSERLDSISDEDGDDTEFIKLSRQLEKIKARIYEVIECQIDKQGRILLPQQRREQVSIRKDIVLVGLGKFFELWGKENWDAGRERLAAITGKNDDIRAALGVL
ncbi:MAG: hypothetical protein LBU39_04655 [Desulfobulbaceae bacterium]|jgi:MraZ protein|nr:hypothetical protein [Desulfobulbaceae bacterium]